MTFLHHIKQMRVSVYLIVFSLLLNPLLAHRPVFAQELVLPSILKSQIVLSGLRINPDNPLDFSFFLDTQKYKVSKGLLELKAADFIQYFLTSLTLSDDSIWVNLSPDEPDRMLSDEFSQTIMGADMLAADELLKKNAAALTDPESETGRKYWDFLNKNNVKVTDDILSRIWIVPGETKLAKDEQMLYVKEANLKLMNDNYDSSSSSLAIEAVEQFILPSLSEVVNISPEFYELRQMYRAYVMAVWYKMSLKESILNKIYSGRNMVEGIDNSDIVQCNRIYNSYLKSFKEGVVNKYVKERDIDTGRLVKKHYFSGGVDLEAKGTVASAVLTAEQDVDIQKFISDDTMAKFNLRELLPEEETVYHRAYYYHKAPDPDLIPEGVFNEFIEFDKLYEDVVLHDKHNALYGKKKRYLKLLNNLYMSLGNKRLDFINSTDPSVLSFQIKLLLINGYFYARAVNFKNGEGDNHFKEELQDVLDFIYPEARKRVRQLNFAHHNKQLRAYLVDAIKEIAKGNKEKSLWIHIGHPGTDLDSDFGPRFLSQFFAALHGASGIVHVPVVYDKRILKQSRIVLGDEVAEAIPNFDEVMGMIEEAGILDQVKWVMVDHNKENQFVEKFYERGLSDEQVEKVKNNTVLGFDHHVKNGMIEKYPIAAFLEMLNGSAAGFDAQLFLGLGMSPPRYIANGLSSVQMDDSENGKTMNEKAKMIHEALTREHGIFGENNYKEMLDVKLAKTVEETVNSEGKPFKGEKFSFWFSVDQRPAGLFDVRGNIVDSDQLHEILELERNLLKEKGHAFSVVKVIDYVEDSVKVNAERIYVILNDQDYEFEHGFRKKILKEIQSIYLENEARDENNKLIELGDEDVSIDDSKGYTKVINLGEFIQRKFMDNQILTVFNQNSDMITRKQSSGVNDEIGGIRFESSTIKGQFEDTNIDFYGIDIKNFKGFTYELQGIVLPEAYGSFKPVVFN